MAIHRFPILVWEDHEGFFTACPVESDTDLAGIDRNPAAAVRQVKAHLEWLYKQEPWTPAPDLQDPVLFHAAVAVRPQYTVDQRVYPCEEPIELRVACVSGRQASGMLVCALPMLGIRFHYYEPESAKRLVAEK